MSDERQRESIDNPSGDRADGLRADRDGDRDRASAASRGDEPDWPTIFGQIREQSGGGVCPHNIYPQRVSIVVSAGRDDAIVEQFCAGCQRVVGRLTWPYASPGDRPGLVTAGHARFSVGERDYIIVGHPETKPNPYNRRGRTIDGAGYELGEVVEHQFQRGPRAGEYVIGFDRARCADDAASSPASEPSADRDEP